MKTVTVLLPVHNGATYLRSSIESVLSQDFSDFELLVLDDDSSDETHHITTSFKDSRIRFSRNPARLGLFATLNRGFRETATTLVRIWSHDDIMLPGSLASFVRAAEEFPSVGLIYCDFYGIDATGRRTGSDERYREQRQRTPDICHSDIAALLFFCFGCLPGNISTTLVRREAWRDVGGFVEGLQQSPDFDMWVRISSKFPIAFLREKSIELREHAAQLGRLGQKQTTTISEEYLIYRHLSRRLKGVLLPQTFDRYFIRQRGRQHMHWIMKAIARLDLPSAHAGWTASREYGYRLKQLIWWIVSANGRLFNERGEDLFDATAPLLVEMSSSGKPHSQGPQ